MNEQMLYMHCTILYRIKSLQVHNCTILLYRIILYKLIILAYYICVYSKVSYDTGTSWILYNI